MNNKIMILILLTIIMFIDCSAQKSTGSTTIPNFNTNSAQGLFAQGQYFLKQKKYDDALNAFSTLVIDYEDNALADDAQFLIAEILSNSNYEDYDLDEALSAYEDLIENYPHSPYVAKAKKRIKQIEKKLEQED